MGRGVAAPPHVEWEGRREGEGGRGQGGGGDGGDGDWGWRRAKMSLFIWAGGWCPLETKAARWKLFDMGI